MHTLNWYRLALVVGVVALLLAVIQMSWQWLSQRRALARQVQGRLHPVRELAAGGSVRVNLGPLEKFLVQADINLTRSQLSVLVLVLLVGVLLVAIYEGAVVTLVTLFFIVSVGVAYWKVRFQRQRRTIHEELPGIVDGVIRNVDAGRSLEHGLISAFDDASPVFKPLVFRLRNAVESGRDYTRLFEDFAAIYSIPSLIMVSIVLRTSSRFGSSIRQVLQQVAGSLRSQQEMRREFLAATAETRFTAVTFAVLPPGLALYMVTINDEYSRVLLDTATGHTMLAVAGALQLLGIFVIWRMIQGWGVSNVLFTASILLAMASVWITLVKVPDWRLRARVIARLRYQGAGDDDVAVSWLSAFAERFTQYAAVRGDFEELGEALEITGRLEEQARIDYLIMCWAMPAVAIVLGFLLTGVIWGSLIAVLGFVMPRRIIRSMAVTAEKQQSLEAIELCHMTRMLLEAGLSIERALRLVAAQARPVMPRLSMRLDRFNRMMEAGADRTVALNELGRNKRIVVLRNYVALMKQSSKLGAKVSNSLDQIISEAQHAERSRMKEETNRIGAKMTIVMMVFMLPALFTLIGGPAVMSIADTLAR